MALKLAHGIEFEELKIDLAKMQHHSPEFAEINPMKQVPAIVHGDFKLSESNAILIYLASANPGVADHWWVQFSVFAFSIVGFIFYDTIAAAFGLPLNPKAAAEGEKLLVSSLSAIETCLLEKDKPFLLGNSEPSIADLALVCEIMQLELANENDKERIRGSRERILKWINTKNATAPYFGEIHSIMIPAKEKLQAFKAKLGQQLA